jgi:hypothetical protein
MGKQTKKMSEPKLIFDGDYCSVWSDNTMTFSDGVGFVGTTDQKETHQLYLALKFLFEKESHQ